MPVGGRRIGNRKVSQSSHPGVPRLILLISSLITTINHFFHLNASHPSIEQARDQ